MLSESARVWYNGTLKTIGETKISLLTHALHYGSSVFEGIRAYATDDGPAIFMLDEHIDRLFYSAGSIFMEMPYDKQTVKEACKQVVQENGLNAAYIRPVVFYGDESMGLNPSNNQVHVAIIAWEWGRYLADEVSVKIASLKRISEQSLTVDAKVGGHYVNSIQATIEAKRMGYDEALLLDHDGYVAEGPGENIFFISGNRIVTPRIGKVLQGITRQAVITLAQDLNYAIEERNVTPHELDAFEAAFFTGTAAEISPIKQIGSITYDTSKGKDIAEAFHATATGRGKHSKEWLSWCVN